MTDPYEPTRTCTNCGHDVAAYMGERCWFCGAFEHEVPVDDDHAADD